MKFIATTDGKNLTFESPIRLSNYLFNFKGTKLEVDIIKLRSKRSNSKNDYYWGVVLETLHKHTGHTADELHEMMKYKFLFVKGDMPYVRSTTSLNTAEMETYLENIRRWAATAINCDIKEPNEV